MSGRSESEEDFYAILGVPSRASDAEIRKAYRNMARLHHPDANNGDRRAEERFKTISNAYRVLSEPSERKGYDLLRTRPAAFGGPRPYGFGKFTAAPASAYRPIYSPPVKGKDLRTRVFLSTRQARRGITVALNTTEVGRPERTVFVRIPAGTMDGQCIRVPKRGGSGLHGGTSGDLYVETNVVSPQLLRDNPGLAQMLAHGHGESAVTLRSAPRFARMVAHFLLNPNDVELNEALHHHNQGSAGDRVSEILRQRRASRS